MSVRGDRYVGPYLREERIFYPWVVGSGMCVECELCCRGVLSWVADGVNVVCLSGGGCGAHNDGENEVAGKAEGGDDNVGVWCSAEAAGI